MLPEYDMRGGERGKYMGYPQPGEYDYLFVSLVTNVRHMNGCGWVSTTHEFRECAGDGHLFEMPVTLASMCLCEFYKIVDILPEFKSGKSNH